jgi:FAD/FMN-containing dehydrogenase
MGKGQTRREIVQASSLAIAAGLVPGNVLGKTSIPDAAARIKGKVITRGDASYETTRQGIVWNGVVPAHRPKLICAVADEHDVVQALDLARRHGLKVAVRGGGHNWVGFSLRDDSLLIDLRRLNELLSLDEAGRIAIIQPAMLGQDLNTALAKKGLAFPVGHCASVALSGFLLNGGYGWNSGGWGPACFSIESAKVATADGRLVTVSETQKPDLLWAMRGGGPGFFGVVTEYRLKTFPVPRAITSSDYFFPLGAMPAAGAWAAAIAPKLPNQVELTLFCTAAHPPLAQQAKSGNGFVAMLDATVFVDTPAEAKAALSPLENVPAALGLLMKAEYQPTTMEKLLEEGAEAWPEDHRYAADNLWTNSPPEEPLSVMRESFLRAPSPSSTGLCVFTTGKNRSYPDAALSMTAKCLLLCYANWERSVDDAANQKWHRALIAALDPFAVGHFVGESDIVASPVRAEHSFEHTHWERLQALRKKYDPHGLFLGEFG